MGLAKEQRTLCRVRRRTGRQTHCRDPPAASPADPGEGSPSWSCADAYWTFAQGYYSKNGKPPRLARPYPPDAAQAFARLYGLTPAAEFGPLKLQSHPANPHRRRPQPGLHQQVGADHPPHVQVGRGGGDHSRRGLPGPPHRRRLEEGPHRGPRDQARAACDRPRWSMPRCPTCPRWWPIWSASSG